MHSIRRSFTAPIKPPPSPVQSPTSVDPSDSVAEIHFSHPIVKIVSFSPPISTYSSAPARLRSASSPLSYDLDYPVDAVETLPWYSSNEKTVASGSLVIEKVRGSTTFLKCGQILQVLMRNTQCWCVDGISKFVIRVRALQYYRIELPSETEEDKVKVEALKGTLKRILRYEVTPCPFKRGFKVDLPAEARTPKKKKAWTPRKSIASAMPDIGNRPQTAPEQEGDRTTAREKAMWAENDQVFRMNKSAGDSNEDVTNESASVSGSEFSTKSHDTSAEPTTPTPLVNRPKVRLKVYALEQELARAAETTRRQSLPVRLGSSPRDEENGRLGLLPSDPMLESDPTSSEELEAAEDARTKRQEVGEKEPLTALKATPSEWQAPEPILPEVKKAPSSGLEQMVNAEQLLDQTGSVHKEEVSSPIKEPSPEPKLDSLLELNVDTEEKGTADDESCENGHVDQPLGSEDTDSEIGIFQDTQDLSTDIGIDSVDHSAAIPIDNTASSGDDESLASSFASFHSAASEEIEDDPLTPSPPNGSAYSPFIKSSDSNYELSPRSHKRELSELTVTTFLPSSSLDDTVETTSQSLQQSSPSYIPAAASSPMSDWPIISSTSSTGPAKIGLRQRALKPRRSYSPLPHPSTLLSSPQTQSTGRRLATTIVQKASAIALGKPIEMAAMLFHVIGRIAHGATVADLLNGDLFNRPTSNQVDDDGNSSADEDDFGMPIWGRGRSRSERRPRNRTPTPSDID